LESLDSLHPTLGVEPYLQGTSYPTGHNASQPSHHSQSSRHGREYQVKSDKVSMAITAPGEEITMSWSKYPTKLVCLEKLLPYIVQIDDGLNDKMY
jgi:hypothetical protein